MECRSPIAQLVERVAVNRKVASSSLAGRVAFASHASRARTILTPSFLSLLTTRVTRWFRVGSSLKLAGVSLSSQGRVEASVGPSASIHLHTIARSLVRLLPRYLVRFLARFDGGCLPARERFVRLVHLYARTSSDFAVRDTKSKDQSPTSGPLRPAHHVLSLRHPTRDAISPAALGLFVNCCNYMAWLRLCTWCENHRLRLRLWRAHSTLLFRDDS